MNEVWIVHTLNLNFEENELRVFVSKSLAQVFAWNFYMQNFFCGDDAEDDWQSLLLDNEIYCTAEDGMNVRAIWITYHRIVEGIEPKITFLIDPKDLKKPKK